ncbi:hypothetical protein [Virgibacillus dokdonensis]|uniref:hypothetical protein n=1 Tax=Virgibacillus dokdonensis TaxID=302167 RepID=UPI00098A54C3|nr:hypothetical protein [Virgibacillus dokdonensis]
MIGIIKLIDYAELAGFSLSVNEDRLIVNNGTNLPYYLKRLLVTYKNEIIQVLEEKAEYEDVS